MEVYKDVEDRKTAPKESTPPMLCTGGVDWNGLPYFLLKNAAKGLYFVPSSSFRGRAYATRRSERTAGCRSPR